MKKDFTPGEWKQSHRLIPNEKKGMYATQIYTEDGQTIATLSWYSKPQEKGIHEGKSILITGTYREANAKLIACAPELLEMLISLEPHLRLNTQEELDKWKSAKNLIKKALF